jgi:hypothetical protein
MNSLKLEEIDKSIKHCLAVCEVNDKKPEVIYRELQMIRLKLGELEIKEEK